MVESVAADHRPDGQGGAQTSAQWLCCSAGGLSLALPLGVVREIIRHPTVVATPLTPPVVRGLINLRGTPMVTIDLAARLGLTPAEPTRRSAVLVIHAVGSETNNASRPSAIALWVDRVYDIVTLEGGAAESVPTFGVQLPPHFVQQVFRWRGQLALGLALAQVLELNAMARQVAVFAQVACTAHAAHTASTASTTHLAG